MPIDSRNDTYRKYIDDGRHFCPRSEAYTGADSLITARRHGWQLLNTVYEKHLEMRGGRHTRLYYFKLIQNEDVMILPVLATPFVERLFLQHKILVLPFPDQVDEDISANSIRSKTTRV